MDDQPNIDARLVGLRLASADLTTSGIEFVLEDANGGRTLIIIESESLVVSSAKVDDQGALTIELGALSLISPPDARFESWQIAGSDGFRVICGPGGQLTSWSN